LSADHSFKRLNAAAIGCGILVLCFWLGSCQQQMAKQPRYKPLAQSTMWPDGRSSRTPPDGTLARSEGTFAGTTSGRLPIGAGPRAPGRSVRFTR